MRFPFKISFFHLTTLDREFEEIIGEEENKLNIEEAANDESEQCQTEIGEWLSGNCEVVEDAEDLIDMSEDTINKMNGMRNRDNPWRDSGYITSDEDDSIIEQFDYKTKIDDKKQERIPSIFSL